jgi:hypothetical protein
LVGSNLLGNSFSKNSLGVLMFMASHVLQG